MIPAPAAPPELVQTKAQLAEIVGWLNDQTLVAVDTESNSMHAYREQVCLIQFSTPERDLLVDPLAFEQIDSLRPFFENPAIEKIFHAAEYDLICLYRDYGWQCQNIFDTMIAARTLGWPKVGLSNVLNKLYGITLNKRYQRANWGQRPLSKDMLRYARLDTYYLTDLRQRLVNDLKARGSIPEVREEFERITKASIRLAQDQQAALERSDGFWRISQAHKLNDHEITRLAALYHYREKTAHQMDRPVFKVIGDKTLMSIARYDPHNHSELREAGLSPRQMKRHAKAILNALQHARSAQPPPRPHNNRPSSITQLRYEALRAWRKDRARKRGVETDVILAREVLWDLAHSAPTTADELTTIDSLGPWRRDRYGEEIIAIIRDIENGG